MNVRRALLWVTVLSIAACKKDDDDKPVATVPTTAPTPTATAAVAPEEPQVKIEPRVKAELDGRADGITGTPVAVTGATASMQAPTGWTSAKGAEFTVATSADKKAQLGAAAFVPAEGPAAKLTAAATALGFSACTWGPIEALSVGKTKLAASAADGLCTRGTTQVKAAYVAPTAEGLLVVGSWDAGGDVANMFGAMRSIAKAGTGTADPLGLNACCSALKGNAKSAPPEQQPAYAVAGGICDTLKNDPNAKAAIAQIRAALAGAALPPTCK